MSAYMQMGHDTENLVGETGLDAFSGLILSPVNRSEEEFSASLPSLSQKTPEIILDPQLYLPSGSRGKLTTHSYYPSDIDTADINNMGWWENLNISLLKYISSHQISGSATPAFIPRSYTNEYYEFCTEIGNHFCSKAHQNTTWLTTIINPNQLSTDQILYYASILSMFEGQGYYVVFDSNLAPRQNYSDSQTLLSMMILISELKRTNKKVVVAFAGLEMPLLKVAGADACGTGKFFNIRRFTKDRFEDDGAKGRGQLPYWIEEGLFTLLREADIATLRMRGITDCFGAGFSNNEWSTEIISTIFDKKKPWVRLSWRHYLCWFSKYASSNISIQTLKDQLANVESMWASLEQNDILFEESSNNGSWIRPWRVALNNFNANRN